MALDDELGVNDVGSNQGYNPDADVQNTESAVQAQPTDDGAPLPGDQASQGAERSWLKQLYDYTLQSFGIGSQSDKPAVPDESSAQRPTEGSPAPTDESQTGQQAIETPEETGPSDRERAAEMRKRPAIAAMGDMTGGDMGEGIHPIAAMQRGLRALVMGEGAMQDSEREQREAAAKGGAVSNVSDDAARRQALKTATTESLDTGSKLLQNYRQHHQALTGKAAAAESMGDIRAATQLFNKAQTFAPNGVETYATPTPSGVRIATLGEDGTAQTIDLDMDQFRELLHTRAGQFDHVLPEGNLQKNLTNLTRSPGIQVDRNTGIVSRGKNYGPGDKRDPDVINPANISTSPRAQIRGGRNPNAEMASDVRANAAGPALKRPLGMPAPGDMSPEARAARMTQWASQNRPGQRERLTEQLRQQDVKNEIEREKPVIADRRLETQERIADKRIAGGLQREDLKQTAQTGRTQMTLDQRNQHLEYLKDKAIQDRLSREFNADVGTFMRNIASKRANGKPITPEEDQAIQQLSDRARQMRPQGGGAVSQDGAGRQGSGTPPTPRPGMKIQTNSAGQWREVPR